MKMKRFLAGLLVTVLLCSGAVSSINAAPNEELQNVLNLNEGQLKGSEDSGDDGDEGTEKSVDEGITAYAMDEESKTGTAEAGTVDDKTGTEATEAETVDDETWGEAGETGTGEKEWYWQVDWSGTGGWTFDGFTPWQEGDKLVAWNDTGIEGTFSYTVTNIPNGIYTLENTISVKKNMTVVMGLQSGKADNDVHSEKFHTDDQEERRRLENTIKVTNHKVTIYYSLKAEADSYGATFKLGNVELYRVGELEDAVSVWKWDFAKADRRAEGWTLNASSGANPWIIEKDNENENDFGLQIWHETAYTGEYSYTIKNIQNGFYTLGNDIRVTSGMAKAVIRLESGEHSVESENIDTDDKQVKDYRLGDTIEVTNHEVTIRYFIEAPAGGRTLAVNNITLYFLGSVEDIDDKGFVNLNGSDKTIRDPDKVEESSYAPYNNLQILNNMEGAKVEVIGTGTGVKEFYIVAAESEHDAYAGVVDDCFVRGDFFGDSWSVDTADHTLEVGIHESMYKSMRASEGDKEYGGISFLFNGSDQDLDPQTYQWKFHSGWNLNDLNIDTTSMWLKLNYTNVGYYKGRLINAHATIKITPAKNRNIDAQGDNEISNGYRGVYDPMLQVSGSLYRGWVWQNVEEFSMDLAFYYSDEDPKVTGYITLGEGNVEQDYSADNADYYVINSLNPEFNTNKKTAWNEEIPHYFGSEYVLPQHEIAKTYIVDSYIKDGKSYNSNIVTSYTTKDADGTAWTQHAYNGGSNPWGGEYNDLNDAIGAPGWPQNSIMIMPKESKSLEFDLGQLARYPDTDDAYHNELSRRATTMMWATISTTPFTRERQKINIEIAKIWDQISVEGLSKIKSVKFELWLEGTKTDGSEYHGEYIAETTVEADKEGNWKGTFGGVPQLEDLRELKGLKSDTAKYVVKECSVTYSDGTVENVTDTKKYEVSGILQISSTTSNSTTTDDKYDINESFVVKNKLLIGSVTVHKLGNSGEPLEGVEFTLQKAKVNGDTWELDSDSERQIGITDADGVCVFEELEKGNYLLTETKTLQGYILLKEPVRITIPYELDGKTYVDLTYTITNGQTFDLPSTGSKGMEYILSLGATLVLTAGGIFLLRRRRESFAQKKRFR